MPLLAAFIVPHPPLIVPEIGKGEETKIQKTIDAYREVAKRIASLKPETILISTPHSILYSDYLHISPGRYAEGSFQSFGRPDVRIHCEYDEELVELLCKNSKKAGIRAGTLGEKNKSLDHGTMVPLHFVNQFFSSYKVVRVSLSGLSNLTHYRFGKVIGKTIEESKKNVVYIASGDLSHKLTKDGPYGFAPEGPEFDHLVTEAMRSGDFYRFLSFEESFSENAAECGLRSFIIMAGALDGQEVRSELLSYEGPFGVGYAVASYEMIGIDPQRRFDLKYEDSEKVYLDTKKANEDAFVQLARMSLENYVKTGNQIKKPDGLLSELSNQKAGVFVSLKIEGRLRGCIGTTEPTTASIADEIIQNAISAGTADPRFEPVMEDELASLVYSVDVLSDSEPIESFADLDPKRFGVIVSFGRRHGLLLPNLDGIDSPEKQVEIALRKAGISDQEKYRMERFEVVRHH